MFKLFERHIGFFKRFSRKRHVVEASIVPDETSEGNTLCVPIPDALAVQPDIGIPLVRFSKSDAINQVLQHLPCKAASVPTAKILGAFREFEDAYNTQSQQRKTAAIKRLLQCLPFNGDKLDDELLSALRSFQKAFATASIANRRDGNNLYYRGKAFPDVPPTCRPQPNSPSTIKSVFAIVNKSVNPDEVIKKVRSVHHASILSTSIHPIKHDQRIKIFINFKTSDTADKVVKDGWSTQSSANKIYFKLQRHHQLF